MSDEAIKEICNTVFWCVFLVCLCGFKITWGKTDDKLQIRSKEPNE